MLYHREATEEKMIEVLRYVMSGVFNVRQAFIQADERGLMAEIKPEALPQILGASLVVAVELKFFTVFTYLWGEDFVNVWD
jgi:hypothetical protein